MSADDKRGQEGFDVEEELRAIEEMPPVSLEEGWRIVEEIHKAVTAHGGPEMTMEEINEEIALCRLERKEREKLNAQCCGN